MQHSCCVYQTAAPVTLVTPALLVAYIIKENQHTSRGFEVMEEHKQLTTLLAIEPEPKTLAKLYQRPNIRYCCQLKVLYKICAHFCHVHGPDYKASKLVIGLMSVFTISCIYPLKNIKITIYTYCYNYDVLWNKQRRVWMTDWPIGCPHISTQHNRRDQKTRHDQASSYKELCKGRDTELYKEKYFPHFQEPCLLVCAFKIFDVIVLFQCFTVTLTKV